MAEKKPRVPLLHDQLSMPEKVMLGQVTNHGGFKVIVKLFEAAVAQAHADTVRLDPEDTNYEHLLSVRTQRERTVNEFAGWIKDSINYHVSVVKAQVAEEDVEAVDAVARTFGIHTVKPKSKKEKKEVSNPPQGSQ